MLFAGVWRLLSSLTGAAESPEFRAKIDVIRRDNRLPALAAAAVLNGEITDLAATGVRKTGTDSEVTIDDKWHLGSCTKSMTATVAAMLVEQRKILWETTVGEVFSELDGVMDDEWKGVTLEQLLTHRGGAPGHPPDDVWMRAWQRQGTPTEQRLKFLGGLITRRPEATPGTKFIYSNQGYAIAGAMLERRTGMSWEELMRTMLFEPLAMHSAGFGAPGTEDDMDQPWGHTGSARRPEPVPPGPEADNPPAIGPAGTVHCSIADLARYCAFHASEGRDGSMLLQPESFKKLHTRVPGGKLCARLGGAKAAVGRQECAHAHGLKYHVVLRHVGRAGAERGLRGRHEHRHRYRG